MAESTEASKQPRYPHDHNNTGKEYSDTSLRPEQCTIAQAIVRRRQLEKAGLRLTADEIALSNQKSHYRPSFPVVIDRSIEAPAETPLPHDDPVAAEILRHEQAEVINSVLADLPERDAAVIRTSFRFNDALSKQELCEQYGLAPEKLKFLRHRILTRLRRPDVKSALIEYAPANFFEEY